MAEQYLTLAGKTDAAFRALVEYLRVFDEPTIGLHPLDVQTLFRVFQTLIEHEATVIVIEHDLDVIRNADYVIDMGPGGGEEGGRIVAEGKPDTWSDMEIGLLMTGGSLAPEKEGTA